MYRITLMLTALGVMALMGCSKDTSNIVATSQPPPAQFSVSPADGEAGVWLNASIQLSFAKRVEIDVVQRNFHLVSELSISDSLCPDPSMASHGSMPWIMADSTMLRHMDQSHSIKGRYSWNADSTQCYFIPDSIMTSRTQHMMHLGSEMVGMLQRRMGDANLMADHGSTMMRGEMFVHFWTLDTTQIMGGHASHHGG